MFILFGTRSLKHKISKSDILHKSCPHCNEGSLIHKLYRRWFTLFFIPIIPLDSIDKFYECDSCGSAYNEKIKSILNKNKQEQQESNKELRLILAKALIGTMTHMAIIDDDLDKQEEALIMESIETFDDIKSELLEVLSNVKQYKNSNNYVFNLLNDARDRLSAETLTNILHKVCLVLLSDNKIDKREEDLIKEYFIACGLPKDMYEIVLNKLKDNTIYPGDLRIR